MIQSGSDSARAGANPCQDQAFPGTDIGTEPRPAGDIVWRVLRDLRRDVPELGDVRMDHPTAIGARCGISRADLHHPT